MKTISYRCDDAKHKALIEAARSAETSVQRVLDHAVNAFISERVAEARFSARAARASRTRALKIMDEIARRGGQPD